MVLVLAMIVSSDLSAEEKWQTLVQRAGKAYTNGEYIAAEKILNDAYHEAEIAHPTGAQ
jgi:hypothetical protein